MKEIIAIVRMNKLQETKRILEDMGFPSFTAMKVMGRGKQKGFIHEFTHPIPVGNKDQDVKRFIPKRMIILTVNDYEVDKIVDVIIKTNKTGNPGDGKIFVSEVIDAVRIRTGDTGEKAIL